jgi:hypothetical protein
MIIKLSTSFPEWPIIRQTPGWSGEWNGCSFHINQPLKECDYWFVMEGVRDKEETRCRKQVFLITLEPPAIKIYDKKFIGQFDKVITCQKNIEHPVIIPSQQGHQWFVGRRKKNDRSIKYEFGYDELKSDLMPVKNKLISVIVSDKKNTADQRQRIKFVNYLKKHLGNKLDVFGRGFNWVEDKWDALADYKYTVSMENCQAENYWTEKLADAYLAGCYPFYYGCSNLKNFFSSDAYSEIDIYREKEALDLINKIIEDNVFEKQVDDIINSKLLVLDKYNLFQLIVDAIDIDDKTICKEREILPEASFKGSGLIRNLFSKIKV